MSRKSESTLKLEQIKNLLFPPMKVHEAVENNETIRYMVDYSIDNNIYSVIIDLQEGNNDDVCQKTLNNCLKTLDKVRKLLDAHMELDEKSKFIVVDTLDDGPSIDEIK